MRSRNKSAANLKIFRALDDFCASRSEPLRNASSARFIATAPPDREFLIRAVSISSLVLSPTLALHRFDHKSRTYFFTIGFETVTIPEGLEAESITGGALTTFLAETPVRPSASALDIRQIVEIGQMGEQSYDGHYHDQILTLYSTIQLFSTDQLEVEESENIFLLLCLGDRRRSEHWIDDALSKALRNLTTISATAIPFTSLCRAVLDVEPAALFLSLYRCLESLYARGKTQALMSELGITGDWLSVAQSLETHLGWYPKEEASLELLLNGADEANLQQIIACFKEPMPKNARLNSVAAKRIYTLRNMVVHYRPFHQKQLWSDPDWPRLCEGLTRLILRVSQ